jgi:hypothetical protein
MNVVNQNIQLIGFMLAIGVPSLTALVGVLLSNSRIGDLRGSLADVRASIADLRMHMDSRFDAHDRLFTEKLRRVEEVMDARLTRIEDHLHLR